MREKREKEGERNINVWLPLTNPELGTSPKTEACALIEIRTGDLLVRRPALNPLSHTSWGIFKCSNIQIISVPEGEEKKQEIESLFEKIMKENFPNLEKEIDFQEVQELRESQKSWTQGGTHQGTS